MSKKIIAICLSVILVFSLSGCSLITRRILNSKADEQESTPNEFDQQLEEGKGDGSFQFGYYVDGENGFIHNGFINGEIIDPDKSENSDNDNDSNNTGDSNSDDYTGTKPSLANKSLHYFKSYGSNGFTQTGRFGQFNFKSNGTFNLSVKTYWQSEYDNNWYCPGAETSGEDTPRWEGTYQWVGNTLKLVFKYKIVELYDAAEDGSPIYLGEEKRNINKTITLELISTDKNGCNFKVSNLPLYSEFDGGISGKTYLFYNEKYLSTLYPKN